LKVLKDKEKHLTGWQKSDRNQGIYAKDLFFNYKLRIKRLTSYILLIFRTASCCGRIVRTARGTFALPYARLLDAVIREQARPAFAHRPISQGGKHPQ